MSGSIQCLRFSRVSSLGLAHQVPELTGARGGGMGNQSTSEVVAGNSAGQDDAADAVHGRADQAATASSVAGGPGVGDPAGASFLGLLLVQTFGRWWRRRRRPTGQVPRAQVPTMAPPGMLPASTRPLWNAVTSGNLAPGSSSLPQAGNLLDPDALTHIDGGAHFATATRIRRVPAATKLRRSRWQLCRTDGCLVWPRPGCAELPAWPATGAGSSSGTGEDVGPIGRYVRGDGSDQPSC